MSGGECSDEPASWELRALQGDLWLGKGEGANVMAGSLSSQGTGAKRIGLLK